MNAAFQRIYDWGSKHPVLSVLLVIGFAIWLLLLPFFLSGCAKPGTYVLFAQNAKHDADMAHAITLRLPLMNQPEGAMIFCRSPSTMVFAKRIDDYNVRVRDPDGEERQLKMPKDESPVGLVTYWPEKSAQTCGIAPPSPVGTTAMLMWGEIVLFMKRTGQSEMSYEVGIREATLRLHYPLTPEDRVLLHKNAVPSEIANILY